MRVKQILFLEDQDLLDQYRLAQDLKLAIDPLGDATCPYMQLPAGGESLQENLTHRQNQMRSRVIYKNLQEVSGV